MQNSFDIDRLARNAAKLRHTADGTCQTGTRRECVEAGKRYEAARVHELERRQKAALLAHYRRNRQEALASVAGTLVLLGLLYVVGHSILYWFFAAGLLTNPYWVSYFGG